MDKQIVKIIVNTYINALGMDEIVEIKFYLDGQVTIRKAVIDPISELPEEEYNILLDRKQTRDIRDELINNTRFIQ